MGWAKYHEDNTEIQLERLYLSGRDVSWEEMSQKQRFCTPKGKDTKKPIIDTPKTTTLSQSNNQKTVIDTRELSQAYIVEINGATYKLSISTFSDKPEEQIHKQKEEKKNRIIPAPIIHYQSSHYIKISFPCPPSRQIIDDLRKKKWKWIEGTLSWISLYNYKARDYAQSIQTNYL